MTLQRAKSAHSLGIELNRNMNVEISNPLKEQKSAKIGQKPLNVNHELLIKTLQEAINRSALQERTILASFTQKIKWQDTIQAFNGARLAGLGECFFWEQPAEQTALIGIGAATTIETSGIARFTDSASVWRALMNDAVTSYAPGTEPIPGSGPVLFGGFAFDTQAPRTQLWSRFPDGLLILPRYLLSYNADHVSLTINTMMQATDSSEFQAQHIVDELSKLQAAFQQSSNMPLEQSTPRFSINESQPASEWMKMVADVVEKIRQGSFEKIVLARDIQLVLDDPAEKFDITSTLQRLRENYPGAYVFAMQHGESFFIGATPERLVLAQDGKIHTMALAGSVRRGETEDEDTRLGAELLHSDKNINEHVIVVSMVQEALKNHCTNVQVSATPQLLKLKNVQHLQTPITGDLIPGRCILEVMSELHPTPAVGGFPQDAALEEIRSTEKLDRGWYAGPLGWIGASGHGEFAVALRSGLVDSTKATLFAGCGIVSSSDPQIEYEESWWKFQVMVRGLGGSNQGY
ncbi:MAG: isochorismate synthase [Ktedonobacteraceae bacterium]